MAYNNGIKLENGYQLFNRVHVRPALDKLHSVLFPQGLEHNKIVQITGSAATGKSTLLIELIARCILPRDWKATSLEGLHSSAIFINTDHQHSLIQIIKMMEKLLITFGLSVIDHKEIVELSLKKLTILNCYSSEEFEMTLKYLEYLLSDNLDVALIAIDSLSCYYWQARDSSDAEMLSVNKHCINLIKILKDVIDDRNIVTIFSKYETERSLNSSIDYTIRLSKNVQTDENVLTVYDHEKDKQFCKNYYIDSMFIFKD